MPDSVPVACTLSEPEMRARRAGLLARFVEHELGLAA
jgi:hypothetical protein